MTCGIYGLFDDETDECLYVGLSKDISGRWNGHLKELRNGNHRRTAFVVWFRENGNDPSAIRWTILEECEKSELNQNEMKWTKILNPLFTGQKPGLNYTWDLSDATKKKISDSMQKYRKFYDFICPSCGETFTVSIKKRVYCSKSCARKGQSEKRKITPAEDLSIRMRKLYEIDKMTMKEMSIVLGFSDATVHKFMVEFNIPRRVAGDSKLPRKPVTDEQKEKASIAMKLVPKITCEFCGDDFKSGGAMRIHQQACEFNGSPTWPHCLHCGKRLSKRTAKYCSEHKFPSMRLDTSALLPDSQ